MEEEKIKEILEEGPQQQVKQTQKKGFWNNKRTVKGKALSAWLIVIITIFMLFIFGLGIYLGKEVFTEKKDGNESNKDSSTNTVVDKNNNGNNSLNNNTNNNDEIKEISIDDEIDSLFKKFRRVTMSDCYGYENEMYELNEKMVINYSYEILTMVTEKLNVEIKGEEVSADYIRNLVKEQFRNYFGKNVTITDNVFWNDLYPNTTITGGYSIDYNNEKYEVNSRAGGWCPEDTIESNLKKAEKDSSYIYIYEEVTIKEKDESDTILKTANYTYKWTYDLQDDGNYYFLKAERIN